MKKQALALIVLIALQLSVWAVGKPGSGDYTYRRDLKISDIAQINNQVFLPQQIVVNKSGRTADPGQVKIWIGDDMVTMKGIDGVSSFGIIAQTQTKYGYRVRLVDQRGTDFSELSIYTDKDSYVEELRFSSKRYGEMTFKLPEKDEQRLAKERQHFTARNAYKPNSYADMVGKSIVPIKRVHNNVGTNEKREETIAMEEKLSFVFDAKTLSVKRGTLTEVHKIKKASVKFDKSAGKINKIIEIKTQKKQLFTLHLNTRNEVEYLAQGTTQYLLR